MNRIEFFKKLFLIPFFPFGLKKLLSKKLDQRFKIQSNLHVAGFAYYEGESCINQLKSGMELTLTAEPHNPHDDKAVEVHFGNTKLGYISRYENEATSRFLLEGFKLTAYVEKVRPNADSWEKISINIWFCP
ncbi:MAG: HIRAN domain-containing protein [Balneola sp.]